MSEPYCLAMVLCDGIYVDSASGKKTLLGTFSTVSSEFPARLQFAVYYALTDCPDKFEITYRLVNSKHLFEDNVEPVFEIKHEIQSRSPLAVVEGQVGVQNAILMESGVYHCELLHGETVLMSRRLVALRPSDLQKGDL